MEGEEEEEGRRKSDQSEVRRVSKQHKCILSLSLTPLSKNRRCAKESEYNCKKKL